MREEFVLSLARLPHKKIEAHSPTQQLFLGQEMLRSRLSEEFTYEWATSPPPMSVTNVVHPASICQVPHGSDHSELPPARWTYTFRWDVSLFSLPGGD